MGGAVRLGRLAGPPYTATRGSEVPPAARHDAAAPFSEALHDSCPRPRRLADAFRVRCACSRRRLAAVARSRPQRHLERNRTAQAMAREGAEARLELSRRRLRLFR